MTLNVTGIDMSAALDTIHHEKLLKIVEKVLSQNSASTRFRNRFN